MILLILVIIGVAVFCFVKGYIFIGLLCLLGGFSKTIGFICLAITSIFLIVKGHFIVGLLPILLIILNIYSLYKLKKSSKNRL